MWHHLHSTQSAKDVGTLYAARNILEARNVTADPKDNFYAASDLLEKFTAAYLVAGALHHFGMDMDGEPKMNIYSGDPNDEDAKKKYVVETIGAFLKSHVSYTAQPVKSLSLVSNQLKCQFCGRQYKRPKALKTHERAVHGHDPSTQDTGQQDDQDSVYNYTRCTLLLGLMRMNQNDAIHMGDGGRLMRLYKYMYLFFKLSKKPKYAYGILETVTQVNCLLTPKLAEQLTWNRSVNTTGTIGTNYPMDLDVEHDNRMFKDNLHTKHGQVTDPVLTRASLSAGKVDKVLKNYDKYTATHRASGKHVSVDFDKDVRTLVTKLIAEEVYAQRPQRHYTAFPDIKPNPLEDIDVNRLKKWMSEKLKEFGKKSIYKK